MTSRKSPSVIPQAPNLGSLRLILSELRKGGDLTARIADRTKISPRHVNYFRHAACQLGLVESRSGPATPAGNKVLRTREGSSAEKQAYVDAISTSPLTSALGIDVVSVQPPAREHLFARCREVAPGLSDDTLRHRVADMFAWRRYLGLDVEPGQYRLPRQLTLDHAMQTLIPQESALNLYRSNPWWHGLKSKPLPEFRRAFLGQIEECLSHDLAPIVAVRGPRQVGKTTAQEQMIAELIRTGRNPKHIMRVQFDELPAMASVREPILRVVEWYEQCILRRALNDLAHETAPAYIFLDEVQNVDNWAIQLKFLADTTRVRIIITGSSALRIEDGRDSLAGRIQTIDVGTLTLSEIARIRNGDLLPTMLGDSSSYKYLAEKEFWLDLISEGERHRAIRDRAFQCFSERGGYPLVHARADTPWDLVAAQLNETVIRRVIRHDLQTSGALRRKRSLLIEEVFRLCCRYAGQTPSARLLAQELHNSLNAAVKESQVRIHLDVLDRAMLVRLVMPLEARLKKRRGAPKLCLIDHALRASWFGELVPLTPHELDDEQASGVTGHLAESVVGTCLMGARGLTINHFPERSNEPEVDFIMTSGSKRVPIEVKYRRKLKNADFLGLQSFVSKRKYNAPFSILVSQGVTEACPDNVIVVPLPTLLMLR